MVVGSRDRRRGRGDLVPVVVPGNFGLRSDPLPARTERSVLPRAIRIRLRRLGYAVDPYAVDGPGGLVALPQGRRRGGGARGADGSGLGDRPPGRRTL